MTNANGARLFASSIVLTGMALALLGCQPQAKLDEFVAAKKDAVNQRYTSTMALFSNGPRGQQTIVLALQPTHAEPPPPTPTGQDALVSKAPMKYRAYLMLVVNSEGGEFQVGQKILSGQVRATYYLYDAYGQLRVISDQYGKIKTRIWPMLGGFDPNEWWISGSFELLMNTDIRLTGRFFARPAPVLVEKFLRDRKL
ncbi:MAG: hypothetical protein PHU85_10615 [Phycisphaerae bacterium]|nr:hypothetical protein [Phycisphaerae bacterium]